MAMVFDSQKCLFCSSSWNYSVIALINASCGRLDFNVLSLCEFMIKSRPGYSSLSNPVFLP